MLTEDAFLARLLKMPNDDTTRLVYADWLDEQGDPVSAAKAEFLRLTVHLASATEKKDRKKKLRRQLQQRAAALDADWLAVASHLLVENCFEFDYPCDRHWEKLKPTEDRAVRFCESCEKNVHYCDTIMEARRHAWRGHCIAVDLGVIRRERDLEQPALTLGFAEPSSFLRQVEERMKPDPVSAEREKRKRDKSEGAETLPTDGL